MRDEGARNLILVIVLSIVCASIIDGCYHREQDMHIENNKAQIYLLGLRVSELEKKVDKPPIEK